MLGHTEVSVDNGRIDVVTETNGNCKDRVYIATGEVEAPSGNMADSIMKEIEDEKTALSKANPPEMIEKAAELKEEKKNSSPFRHEGCCDKEAPPALCCCEAILTSYKKILSKPDIKFVSEIRSKDPLLNDCYKLLPNFKSKIDALEMGE